MAYSEEIATRLETLLAHEAGITTRKMFGGIAFMLNGNMCCGVVGDKVMLRLGNEGAAEAMKEPGVAPMDFTGKPLKSMVYLVDLESLDRWVERAAEFAATLPPK